jgi:bifunctional UDP-N-acetylglucosamine pyrophosphorylase/glucosamine-1-phosphate N-acetyltransferase
MVKHVLELARSLAASETVVVVPPDSADLQASLGQARIVEQSEPLGTAHAVLQARAALGGGIGQVLVLYADTPLVRLETARRLLDELDGAVLALLTAELSDPLGYGRVVREGPNDGVARVVEEDEAGPDIRKVREVNSGLMAVDAQWLWKQLPDLPLHPKGEYYLTDLVGLALSQGRSVAAVRADQPAEALGINSQTDLAQANRVAWDRMTQGLMATGVSVLDPPTTYVDLDVRVGSGTVLHPNTHLQGATQIGRNCQIGPNAIVVDSIVGDGSRIWCSTVEGSELDEEVQIGPYSHVRPGCHLEREVCMGTFAEAKASRIGRGTQMHHFCYVGDADLGERVNVGAGTVTCNFDGQEKHRTVIGDEAFIGSDSMLVAPVRIGARARTGAGSVVTRDVPDGATVVGVPAKPFPGENANLEESE